MEKIDKVFVRNKLSADNYQQIINFQSYSWYYSDFEDDELDDEGESVMEYQIYMFGVTDDHKSITVKINDYKPYFYVQIPDSYMETDVNRFYKFIKSKLRSVEYGLVGNSVTRKKKLYPYLGQQKFRLMKLIFKNDKAFKKCKYMFINQDKYPFKIEGLDKYTYNIFDAMIEHINRFCHKNDLETTGWNSVSKYNIDTEFSNTQLGIIAESKNIKPNKEKTSISRLSIFSWDIECLPENTEEFPNPDLLNDVICMIGVTLQIYGTKSKQKFVLTNKKCSEIEDVVVIQGSSEEDLLINFCKFIKIVDPDLFIGYNTWGFDDNYLWKRLKLHNIEYESFSRLGNVYTELIKKELSSSAYGNNEYKYINFIGRETFDVIEAVRREHKLESYSLNYVSEHFLKKNKVDLPYRELFEILACSNPDKIAKAAVYCIGDSELPLEIVLKLNMIPNYIEMAKTTYVPISWLLFRGQQCKVFSLIVKKVMNKRYVIPEYDRTQPVCAFKGATVLTAKNGLYYDPIAGLDFASLYPSIMIAYNLDYSTFIADEKTMKYVKENGIPYETIEWEEDENQTDDNSETSEVEDVYDDDGVHVASDIAKGQSEKNKSGIKKFSYSFVQCEDNSGNVLEKGQRGILGEILLELWQGRKATKKLMKNEKDPFMYAVLNGKQLAQKVTMNSAYGFSGADKGIFPLKPIAACTTAVGRKMIKETSSMATEKFGAITIYGDSIPGYEIITVKKNGKVSEQSIEEFASIVDKDWEEYRGFKVGEKEIYNKMYKNVEGLGYLTYTHDGYQPIKKIIKHDTTKKLYKITAKDTNGKLHSVVVTEGHSLINSKGNLLQADQAKVGDKLWEY
jgi:DNA polymerase delta subunit 1